LEGNLVEKKTTVLPKIEETPAKKPNRSFSQLTLTLINKCSTKKQHSNAKDGPLLKHDGAEELSKKRPKSQLEMMAKTPMDNNQCNLHKNTVSKEVKVAECANKCPKTVMSKHGKAYKRVAKSGLKVITA
jgi:hypothetical protein